MFDYRRVVYFWTTPFDSQRWNNTRPFARDCSFRVWIPVCLEATDVAASRVGNLSVCMYAYIIHMIVVIPTKWEYLSEFHILSTSGAQDDYVI